MNARSLFRPMGVTLCTLLLCLSGAAHAAALSVTVRQVTGQPLSDAVVVLESAQGYPVASGTLKATLDQRDLMFVPEVLVVRTGTAVDFPNSDQVRHQVYSFSGAKKFQLPLYAGRTQPPVVFDKPGLVTLGCNIHDNMIAYIMVTDSPWFGQSNARGNWTQHNLPTGTYTLKVWHSLMNEGKQFLEQTVQVTDEDSAALVQLKKPLRAGLHYHSMSKQWQDY